jgi:hypothetical protein
MNESEVLFQISHIVNGHNSFSQAVEQVALLLEREADGKALFIEHPDYAAKAPDILELFDSFDQPYRSLYVVDLRDGGKTLGKATLCFAANQFHGTFPQRLADFVGEQLGMLLVRTQLAAHSAKLKNEIERIEQDLAARKVRQRAEGILVAGHGMTRAIARRWIARLSQRTGLSEPDVAGRIIAYHQATGLFTHKDSGAPDLDQAGSTAPWLWANHLEEQRIA